MMNGQNEVNQFWDVFNTRLSELKKQLDNRSLTNILTSLEQEANADDKEIILNQIKSELNQLQKLSTDASLILPLYDVKRTQEEIESCLKKIRKIELTLNPRKKFTFSCFRNRKQMTNNHQKLAKLSNNNIDTTSENKVSSALDQCTDKVDDNIIFNHDSEGSCLIHNKTKETILLNSQDIPSFNSSIIDSSKSNKSASAFQLYIDECNDCLISVQAIIGSVRLENNNHCIILLGPCCTANYLENCHHCEIYMICHQLRIHNCSDCKLHVLVNSHPIIEDCTNMLFYKNNYYYDHLSKDILQTGLSQAQCWNNVIDFRWHKSVASPHWKAINNQDDDDDESDSCDNKTTSSSSELSNVFSDVGWSLVHSNALGYSTNLPSNLQKNNAISIAVNIDNMNNATSRNRLQPDVEISQQQLNCLTNTSNDDGDDDEI